MLEEAHKIMKGLAKEIRSLSYLLHPPVLDELGLTSAIEEYASGFSQRSGIRAEVEISSEIGRLPQESRRRYFGSFRRAWEISSDIRGAPAQEFS